MNSQSSEKRSINSTTNEKKMCDRCSKDLELEKTIIEPDEYDKSSSIRHFGNNLNNQNTLEGSFLTRETQKVANINLTTNNVKIPNLHNRLFSDIMLDNGFEGILFNNNSNG